MFSGIDFASIVYYIRSDVPRYWVLEMGIFGEQLVWWELKTEEMDRIVAGVPSKKAIKQLAASGRIFVEPFVKIRKYPKFQLFNCFQIVYFFIELGDIKW